MIQENAFAAMSAEEAHQLTKELIDHDIQEIISATNAKIYDAIHNGFFEVNSPVCRHVVQQEVMSHYDELGYETKVSGNNMIIIAW